MLKKIVAGGLTAAIVVFSFSSLALADNSAARENNLKRIGKSCVKNQESETPEQCKCLVTLYDKWFTDRQAAAMAELFEIQELMNAGDDYQARYDSFAEEYSEEYDYILNLDKPEYCDENGNIRRHD